MNEENVTPWTYRFCVVFTYGHSKFVYGPFETATAAQNWVKAEGVTIPHTIEPFFTVKYITV